MRISCNGCRVLRKGCSESCSIRPCLQWIKSPDSQANATVFLAKFYGRAGLMNLINAGPLDLRPAIFRSLLYEACGRIVNPIYGSVGLLWSGSWHLCQAAVEAVLCGAPIVQIPSDAAAAAAAAIAQSPPMKAYDIRHVVGKDKDPAAAAGSGSASELHRVNKGAGGRFKRSGEPRRRRRRARSHESEGESTSAETVEASHVSQGAEPGPAEAEVGLELTLGPQPLPWPRPPAEPERRMDGLDAFDL